MENIYLGRQPILDINENLDSYEVLYSTGNKAHSYAQNDFIPAAIISSILNKFGTHLVLGNRKAFVKIGEKFLLSDMIFTIPNEFFIFSLLEEIEMSERVIERLEQLKAKGYILAIDELSLSKSSMQKYEKAWKQLSFIKINLHKSFINIDEIKSIVKEIKSRDIKIVGTKIEDEKRYELAKDIGCELFQGYFFSKPKIFENAKYDPARANVLKLYSLLMEDTNIDEITAEFEKNHTLTVELLQFINSGAFHFKNKISSIHHILTLVGRMPLAQWLMLMIYSKSVSKSNKMSPIMLMIKNRTELMESIFKKIKPDARSNELGQAYFVGVLSLIDTVFCEKLETILDDMNIDEAVRDALLYDKGVLGEIYALVRDVEDFIPQRVSTFTAKYKLPSGVIASLSIGSMKEVTAFENAISKKKG